MKLKAADFKRFWVTFESRDRVYSAQERKFVQHLWEIFNRFNMNKPLPKESELKRR